jgi:SAM-dependent methyltransferase
VPTKDADHAHDAPDHVARNRAFWDADSDAYQEVHGEDLAARALAWGAWRQPEADLNVLGDVADRDVLELGCGAAQWSAALAATGARCVGIDLSIVQLGHARAHTAAAGVSVALSLANAESLPFRPAAFDIVFCDHGAMSFCDPMRTLPEVARVLRPGGLLAFCATNPLVYLTWNNRDERQTRTLHMDYAALGRIDFGDGTVDWVVSAGEWIELLHAFGFEVCDLIELRAPEDATTTYAEFVPTSWAKRWPAEQIWRARRR